MEMTQGIVPHEMYDLAVPVGTVIAAVIGLMIRSAILSSKVEVVQAVAVVDKKIDVHLGEDAIIHSGIEKRLDKLEAT